ncbi:MAG: hypothetical protein LBT97_00420 [Planctomycetota bacterium]|jgi:hypothetical protein|nr:hypothetical protein [Planctomycetota bacterium]
MELYSFGIRENLFAAKPGINLYRIFTNWAFKPPNAQFVKITILAAQAFLIFAQFKFATKIFPESAIGKRISLSPRQFIQPLGWTFGENRANHRPISSKDVTAYGPMG